MAFKGSTYTGVILWFSSFIETQRTYNAVYFKVHGVRTSLLLNDDHHSDHATVTMSLLLA